MKIEKRVVWFGVFLSLSLLISVVFFRSDAQVQPGLAGEVVSSKTDETVDGGETAARQRSRGFDLDSSETAEGQSIVTGVVVDAGTGAPIPALITATGVITQVADVRLGSFAIQNPEGSWDRRLRIRAMGYHERIVEVDLRSADLGEIGLEGVLGCSVIVLKGNGQLASGVRVSWSRELYQGSDRPIGTRRVTDHERNKIVGESWTDGDGRASFESGRRLIATVLETVDGDPGISIAVKPGHLGMLQLPSCTALVQFIEATSGAAIEGLEVEWLSVVERAQVSRSSSTDSEGKIRVPGGEGVLLFRRPENRLSEIWSLARSLTPVDHKRGKADLGIVAPCGELTTVWVHRSDAYLELIDDLTGEFISGALFMLTGEPTDSRKAKANYTPENPAYFVESPRMDRYNSRVSRTNRSYIQGGRLQFPSNESYQRLGNSIQFSRSAAPTLWVEGYRPVELRRLDELLTGSWHGPIRLARAKQRGLNLVYADGAPYLEAMRVFGVSQRLLYFSANGVEQCETAGMYGPFDWSEGDLTVELQGQRYEVSESALQSADWVTLKLPGETGSILVNGVPGTVPELGVRNSSNFQWHAGVDHGDGTILIQGLRPGNYMVGSRMWTRSAMLNQAVGLGEAATGATGLAIVKPNEESVVVWSPEWGALEGMGGRVTVGSLPASNLAVVPIYGIRGARLVDNGIVPNVAFNIDRGLIPLDANGGYRVRKGQPVPGLLIVCLPERELGKVQWEDENSFSVVGALVPGQDLHVEMGTLEFYSEDERSGVLVMGYDLAPESLPFAFHSNYNTRKWYWNAGRAGATHVVRHVPEAVHTVRIDGVEMEVKIIAGQTTRVKIP